MKYLNPLFLAYIIATIIVLAVVLDKSSHNALLSLTSESDNCYELNSNVINYLSYRGQLSSTFNGREASHLKDVRDVLSYSALAALLLLAYLVLANGLESNALFTGSIILLATITLAEIIAIIDFDWFFSSFHMLLFAKGTWTFSPFTETLTRLYTERFFRLMGIRIAALCQLTSIVIIAANKKLFKSGRKCN